MTLCNYTHFPLFERWILFRTRIIEVTLFLTLTVKFRHLFTQHLSILSQGTGANLPISRKQPASRKSASNLVRIRVFLCLHTSALPLFLFTNRQAIPSTAIARIETIHRLQNVTATAWCWAPGLASWEKLPVWCWAITSENGESSSRWSCKLARGWGSCSSASSTGRQSGKLYIGCISSAR